MVAAWSIRSLILLLAGGFCANSTQAAQVAQPVRNLELTGGIGVA